MTDQEYAAALRDLADGRPIHGVIVDPSASSFLELLRREGWKVQKADNDVLSGIRLTADLLKSGKIVLCRSCPDCLREIEEYVWQEGPNAREQVKKERDHAMDDMRYFCATVLKQGEASFACLSVERWEGR